MNLKELQAFDSSIELVGSKQLAFDIAGISNAQEPLDETLVYIKGKRFLNNLGEYSKRKSFPKSLGLIQKDYFKKLDKNSLDFLEESFGALGIVESVAKSMCFVSKPFYEQKFSGLNYQADGRTLGTCDIDSDAEIAPGVFIGENVKIGSGTKIMAGCNILPCSTIGENCVVFPNVTLYPYVRVGNRTTIHAGTVIGTDGFGYNFFDGKHQKIWHFSGVQIGDDVEIGSNTMIDAGAFTPTEIGNGTKIDNDVQISHNVKVREHVIICGKTGLAGSVEVKDFCSFGAAAGVAPSAVIGKGAQIAGRAVVSENAIIPPASIYAGHPARPLKEWLKSQATLWKLVKKK